jgi:hypothetical protein
MEHHIYAIRDRLVDYFQAPFVASGDKQVMASLVKVVNDKEQTHAIAQAPHHFELWKIGKVTEDGYILPGRELLCDCASLVPADLRDRGASANGAVPRPVAGGAIQTRTPDREDAGDGTGT